MLESMKLNEYTTDYQEDIETLWVTMHSLQRQCFTPGLLREGLEICNQLDASNTPPKYLVLLSGHPDIFNSGGDLVKFTEFIVKKDRQGLLDYGLACIDLIYWLMTGGKHHITTIAGVAGDALGGGFESALACNYLFAEKRSQFAFPEIIFRLFPGMGGFILLEKYLGIREAERAVAESTRYSAEELFTKGVVYNLFENGECRKGIEQKIKSLYKKNESIGVLQMLKRRALDVSYNDLKYNVEQWVDVALNISDKDLRMMAALSRKQTKKAPQITPIAVETRVKKLHVSAEANQNVQMALGLE